jgi:hypothetical protein
MSKALAPRKPPSANRPDHRIFIIRKQKVMISTQLATLYHVEPRVLMQAVKRNIERFPKDFMFHLTAKEWSNLKSQIVISNTDSASHGGIRALPYCFTEFGVAMLSSVLNSRHAIEVNIDIMRTFVRLRGEDENRVALANRLANLEQRYDGHDSAIKAIFTSIREFIAIPIKKTRRIGF